MIIIKDFKGRTWCRAEVWEDEKLIRRINYKFEIKDDFITEFEAAGGSGIGYTKGPPIWRMSLAGKEFEVVDVPNNSTRG